MHVYVQASMAIVKGSLLLVLTWGWSAPGLSLLCAFDDALPCALSLPRHDELLGLMSVWVGRPPATCLSRWQHT